MLSFLKRRIQGHMLHDVGSAFSAGASIIGSGMQSDSADDAAKASAAAAAQMRNDLKWYRSAGKQSINKLQDLLGIRAEPVKPKWEDYNGDKAAYDFWMDRYNKDLADYNAVKGSSDWGSLLRGFTGEDLQNEPGYQFGLDQGMQALDRGAAARGNYLSGAALKAGQRYAQDYAGTKFNDAFNRDSSTKSRVAGFLSGVASLGQNAAAQSGNAAMQNGAMQGNYAIQQGNALSAGLMGVGNAYQNYQNNQFQNNLLSSLNNNPAYSSGAGNSGGWNMGNWGWSNGSDSWG